MLFPVQTDLWKYTTAQEENVTPRKRICILPFKENKFLFKGVSSSLSTATITFKTITELIACSLLTAPHGYLEHEL